LFESKYTEQFSLRFILFYFDRLLEIAGLKLLGRNYYSFDKKIELDRFKLTLFPGFMTAVNVYEGQLMINVDLSTKVMNKQTVYSILMDKFHRINDTKQAQDASLKELIGQIVLTPFVIIFPNKIFFFHFSFFFVVIIMKHIKLLILLGIKIQHINLLNVMVHNKHFLNIIKKYNKKRLNHIYYFCILEISY
jgi:hypothetical protein